METTARQPAIAAASLPASTDPNLILDPTTPAEYEQTWRLNVAEWSGPLTEEQFYRREIHLLRSAFTGDGRSTAWILTSPDLPLAPDGTRSILTACETLQKTAYIARDGKIDKITSHVIASVFTRPEHRGKKYAARMIQEVGKKLETWQQPCGHKGMMSALYSDIGKKFYARFGWKAFPSTHILLAPLNESAYDTLKAGFPEVQDLTSSDLVKLNAVPFLVENLKEASLSRPGVPHVAFEPSIEQMQWHHLREEYLCHIQGLSEPKIKGAVHKETGIAMIWVRIYYSNPAECHLNILHVVIPPAAKEKPEEAKTALAALLLRAQYETSQWKLPEGVELWDPSELVLAAAQKLRTKEEGEVKVISRDENHISSLKWDGGDDEVVVWMANEKFAWG